jgi:hypothetical protein
MAKQEQLSFFAANGKAFYFNKAVAANGTPYLVINAVWSKQNTRHREGLLLFPPHYQDFLKCFREAVEALAGEEAPQAPQAAEAKDAPTHAYPKCENCGKTNDSPDMLNCSACRLEFHSTGKWA